MTDQEYMARALALAETAKGWTAPNPMVGAVIVKDGRIIGEGCHERCGQPHAERNALARCTEDPAGATMYVTLEPCCHHGRQPPCVEAIIQAKIARVVVGSGDPNPLVAGKGLQILRDHGIAVTEHVLQAECEALNAVFFHYIRTKRPYVVVKYAMTLDGKIAAYTGQSQWITGEAARHHVQTQRHRFTAIMAGVGTVLADDPRLTCRLPESKNPIRIICDTHLRTPLSAKVVTTAREVPTIIATCCREKSRWVPYVAAGCEIMALPEKDGHVDLTVLMEHLGAREIDSILVEGGGTLHWSVLEAGLANRVQAYIAPKLLGGESAKTPIEGRGFPHPDKAVVLKAPTVTRLGDDFLIESEV